MKKRVETQLEYEAKYGKPDPAPTQRKFDPDFDDPDN